MKYSSWILLFITLNVFAQTNSFETPFNSKVNKNAFVIKGKVLPYLMGNGLGINNSLGFEIGFLKTNSIGLEGFYNYYYDQEDKVTDRQGVFHETGNLTDLQEKALQMSYRHYYNFQRWRSNKGIAFYNGLFYRLETDIRNTDPNYKNEYINQKTGIRAGGLLMGMIMTFPKSSHLYMDYNFTIGKQFKNISSYNIENNQDVYEQYSYNSFYFNIGVSLNYWF